MVIRDTACIGRESAFIVVHLIGATKTEKGPPMKNPYDPPSSESKDQPASPGLRSLILGVVFAVLAALIPTVVTPSFKWAFDSFGAELPMATQLFLDNYRLLWLLPILVIMVHFFWPKKKRLPLWLGIFSFALTIPFSLWALYSPVFHLGSVL
jgi:hypothetical protein